jgi:CBS domain-containing protein
MGPAMERRVQEIMNRELLAVGPSTPVSEVRGLLRAFGIGAAPVCDEARRPVGVISVRDVLYGEADAKERMTTPAICVDVATSVGHAARQLAVTDMHHLIVVDGSGAAVGMLSSLDLLREILGLPAHHPGAFPHWDEATHASWTDDWPLGPENRLRAHDGPGVLVLLRACPGEADEVVWIEACVNSRARVSEMIDRSEHEASLAQVLALGGLRFRTATAWAAEDRARIVTRLRDRLAHVPPKGAT